MQESSRIGHLGGILRWYIIRELVFPTLVALGGFTVLILTKDLLGFSDLIINRGFGPGVVVRIAFYEVVPLVARTLPFAVLVGVLVGLGRLRDDREILALEAAGASIPQLLGPVLLFTAALTVVGLVLSGYAAPWATRALEASLEEISRKNPGIALRPGLAHEFDGSKILVREVSARGDQLRGVLLWTTSRGQTLLDGQTIFAEQGLLTPREDGSLQLSLFDGVTLLSPREGGGETRFGSFRVILRHNATPGQRNADALAGVAVGQLIARVRSEADGERSGQPALGELHRRFALPIASVVFGLLAVPLAFAGRRFSRSAGGVTGLLVTVLYYGLVQLGDGLAQANVLRVSAGVWLPNLIVGVLALLLLWGEQKRLTWKWKTGSDTDTEQTASLHEASLSRFQRYLLPRYVVRHYAPLLGVSFGVLLVGYLLVDVLERLEWFARYHASALEIVRFYSARLPLLVSRVVPMALLLATALTVSVLSWHRELIAMRACGIAVVRALSPILFIAGGCMPGYFLLNEVVVPRANAWADQLKETEIKERGQATALQHMVIWYQAGTRVYQAVQLNATLGEVQELSMYELGEDGLPISRTDARAARYLENGVWELVDPVRIEISEHGLRKVPAAQRVQLGEAPSETADTMHLGVQQLVHEIREVEASGYAATGYRVDFHVKLAAPLACLLLPAVALFFAIGGPPFPGPALTLLVSFGLGIGYVLLTGVGASLGYGGFLPPSVAGWGPPALLMTAAGGVAAYNRG